jgi:hypothetical protein
MMLEGGRVSKGEEDTEGDRRRSENKFPPNSKIDDFSKPSVSCKNADIGVPFESYFTMHIAFMFPHVCSMLICSFKRN